MQGYELKVGEQKGILNLNDREINFVIQLNNEKYYIMFYENGEFLFGGYRVSNGADFLYNREHLGLGSSLQYLGDDDIEEGYLVYEA